MQQWVIEWEGETLRSQDALAGVLIVLAELGFGGPEAVSPLNSPRSAIMWVAFVEARRTGTEAEAALATICGLPIQTVLAAVNEATPTA